MPDGRSVSVPGAHFPITVHDAIVVVVTNPAVTAWIVMTVAMQMSGRGWGHRCPCASAGHCCPRRRCSVGRERRHKDHRGSCRCVRRCPHRGRGPHGHGHGHGCGMGMGMGAGSAHQAEKVSEVALQVVGDLHLRLLRQGKCPGLVTSTQECTLRWQLWRGPCFNLYRTDSKAAAAAPASLRRLGVRLHCLQRHALQGRLCVSPAVNAASSAGRPRGRGTLLLKH